MGPATAPAGSVSPSACGIGSAATGAVPDEGGRAPVGVDGRLREVDVGRRLVRLANWSSAVESAGTKPTIGRGKCIQANLRSRFSGNGAGSEHRLGGGQLGEGGDEAVPAPTACVGDVCGATSCARSALNHRMLWSARGNAPPAGGAALLAPSSSEPSWQKRNPSGSDGSSPTTSRGLRIPGRLGAPPIRRGRESASHHRPGPGSPDPPGGAGPAPAPRRSCRPEPARASRKLRPG